MVRKCLGGYKRFLGIVKRKHEHAKKKISGKFWGNEGKKLELAAKSGKRRSWHPKKARFVHLNVQTLHPKINTSYPKMDQLVGFLLHPPLSEIAKKLEKMLRCTPHFQSAFGTAVHYSIQYNIIQCIVNTLNTLYSVQCTIYMKYTVYKFKAEEDRSS